MNMLQQLRTRRKFAKNNKPDKQSSLIVECPACKALITVKNAKIVTNRFCWRCLKELSVNTL
jgi:predicted Zn finger-like uncharacterized protein